MTGHRLAREATRAKGLRQAAVYAQLTGMSVSVSSWFANHESRFLWAALGAVAGAALAQLGAARWARRARWYADTPGWVEQIEDAPTVRLFPRFEAWLNRQVLTWSGVGRILAVPALLIIVAVVFRDSIPDFYQP